MEHLQLILIVFAWVFSTLNMGFVLHLMLSSKFTNSLNATKLDLITVTVGSMIEHKMNQKLEEKSLQIRQQALDDATELFQTLTSAELPRRPEDVYSKSTFQRI